jgi:hypothetical protein
LDYRENYNWHHEIIEDIIKQAETGGMFLTGMGNDKGQRIYWDYLVLNANQSKFRSLVSPATTWECLWTDQGLLYTAMLRMAVGIP